MPAQSFHLCAHSFSSLISESPRLKKGSRSSRGQHKWTNMPGNSLCNQKDLPAISTHETWYMQTDKNKHNNAFTDTATSIQILTGMHPVRASILTNAHKETHTTKQEHIQANTDRRTQKFNSTDRRTRLQTHTHSDIHTPQNTHTIIHSEKINLCLCVDVHVCDICMPAFVRACVNICVHVCVRGSERENARSILTSGEQCCVSCVHTHVCVCVCSV